MTEAESFAAMVAVALRRDLGRTRGAIKTLMQWTGASERTVKYWLSGERAPSGDHFLVLARHSDAVVESFLDASGFSRRVDQRVLLRARERLDESLALLDRLIRS